MTRLAAVIKRAAPLTKLSCDALLYSEHDEISFLIPLPFLRSVFAVEPNEPSRFSFVLQEPSLAENCLEDRPEACTLFAEPSVSIAVSDATSDPGSGVIGPSGAGRVTACAKSDT